MDGRQLTGVDPNWDPPRFWALFVALNFQIRALSAIGAIVHVLWVMQNASFCHTEKEPLEVRLGVCGQENSLGSSRSMEFDSRPCSANLKATATVTSPRGYCLRSCGTRARVVAWAGEPRQRLLFTLDLLQPDTSHPSLRPAFHPDQDLEAYKRTQSWLPRGSDNG